MQRKEMVALVAGASVGVGGGALGAFLACMAGQALAHGFLNQFGDHYIDLEQPTPQRVRHSAQQASLGSAPVAPPATSDLSLPNAEQG